MGRTSERRITETLLYSGKAVLFRVNSNRCSTKFCVDTREVSRSLSGTFGVNSNHSGNAVFGVNRHRLSTISDVNRGETAV